MMLAGGIQTPEAKRLFGVLFVFTLLTFVGMQITGAPLKNDVAPGGIITFELVGTLEGSQAIIDSWTGLPLVWAGVNMGLDFLFLFFYGVTIALACLMLAARKPANLHILEVAGKWLAAGVLFAAVLDIIENISLILLLTGSESEFLPQLARSVAIPKFGLVLLALLYVVVAGLMVLMKKEEPPKVSIG